MFLKYRNETMRGLLVLVITLSQISEVSGWDWFNYWSYRLFHWMPWYDKLPWAINKGQVLAYEGRKTYYKKIFPKPRAELYELWDIVSITQPGDVADDEMTTPLQAGVFSSDSRRHRYGPFPINPDQPTTPNDMLPRQQRPEVIWDVVVSVTLGAFEKPDEEVPSASDEQTDYLLQQPPDASRRLFGPFPLDPEQQLLDAEENFTF